MTMPSSEPCSAGAEPEPGYAVLFGGECRWEMIDVPLDVRSDTPPGKDSDSHGKMLKRHRQMLWGKSLPDGRRLSSINPTPDVYRQADGRIAMGRAVLLKARPFAGSADPELGTNSKPNPFGSQDRQIRNGPCGGGYEIRTRKLATSDSLSEGENGV